MRLKRIRRIVQALAIVIVILIPVLNREGIVLFTGSLYSLAIGPLWITDPLSGFQVILSTLTIDITLLVSMLVPIVIALAFGRVFCGWFCPQNTISEIFDYLSERAGVRRLLRPRPSPRLRYAILVILLIAAPLLAFPVANTLSAPGIISVQVSKFFYEATVGLEIGLIGVIVLAEIVLVRRGWCNLICPVGSFLGLFRFRKTMKVVYREEGGRVCSRCRECVKACQLGLNPMGEKIYPLCHNCGDCIAACEKMDPARKPLQFKF